jgi:hypothetical protein
VGSLNIPRKLVLLIVFVSAISLLPQVFSEGALTVTVSTNQAQYAPGETVTIFGKVVDNQSNPVVGAAVSIEVNEPPIYVQLVSSDQSGSYSNQFALSNAFPQGQYTIYVTAHKGSYTAVQQTQFTVQSQTASSRSSSSSTSQTAPPSKCFIATATYGSDVSPEVTLLRNLRDKKILQTSTGRSFMLVFNSFYYSFSPQVASFISSNSAVRSVTRIMLYPLIGILYISDRIFAALSYHGELAVVVSGIFTATGIGVVYIGPVIVTVCRIRGSNKLAICRTGKQMACATCLTAVLGLIFGEVLMASQLLAVAAVSVVLSFIFLGGLSTLYLTWLVETWKASR